MPCQTSHISWLLSTPAHTKCVLILLQYCTVVKIPVHTAFLHILVPKKHPCDSPVCKCYVEVPLIYWHVPHIFIPGYTLNCNDCIWHYFHSLLSLVVLCVVNNIVLNLSWWTSCKIRVGNYSALASISASSTKVQQTWKKFKLNTINSGILEQRTLLELLGQAAEFKF